MTKVKEVSEGLEKLEALVEAPVEKTVRPEPVADVVFNAKMAEDWLGFAHYRLVNAFRSLRFDLTQNSREFNFLFMLAVRSVAKSYKEGRVELPGIFYCLKSVSDHPALEGMQRIEDVGKYAAFTHK